MLHRCPSSSPKLCTPSVNTRQALTAQDSSWWAGMWHAKSAEWLETFISLYAFGRLMYSQEAAFYRGCSAWPVL